MYVYIYCYIYMYMYVCLYIYIYILLLSQVFPSLYLRVCIFHLGIEVNFVPLNTVLLNLIHSSSLSGAFWIQHVYHPSLLSVI